MSFLTLFISAIFACTSFLIPQNHWMMKSYDWHVKDGYVVSNPRGLEKSSLILNQNEKKAHWTSRYASMTFHQFGMHFPNGGINEKGLAIEILWLNQTEFPASDKRPVVNEVEWIQYQLDQYENVGQIAKNIHKLRIRQIYANVHYFACDANGDCLTVEYLNGKPVVYQGKDLPYPTLTNNTYQRASSYIKNFDGFGGNWQIPYGTYSSLERFVRATAQAKDFSSKEGLNQAFSILDSVKKDGYTRWQILYHLDDKKIHFRTTFGNPMLAEIKAKDFFTSCDKDVARYFHLSNNFRGKIKRLDPLSYNENYSLVKASLSKIFNGDVPERFIRAVASHPYTFTCAL